MGIVPKHVLTTLVRHPPQNIYILKYSIFRWMYILLVYTSMFIFLYVFLSRGCMLESLSDFGECLHEVFACFRVIFFS